MFNSKIEHEKYLKKPRQIKRKDFEPSKRDSLIRELLK